ncbi:hypothetical protein L228DRAFT_270831 [Xylona heveae TC161]|uniref:Uncharacterized protein n=1 Tax=Xylona heveae (strain CBS 132557 / TC161) TaxID=1328760 RepID=A0A165A7S6_XYLHT|nr:hypothetical protein L228DRAFT_270831 [Xylona heveae TC161]KZF20077.1 hypothetical protein L228DRAFT_270831 [Xylona heveae TC161]
MATVAQYPLPATTPRESLTRRDRISPEGPCNFRHLTSGSNAPLCGCRRFWDSSLDPHTNRNDQSISAAQNGWCMCGHHACFHDMDSGVQHYSVTGFPSKTSTSGIRSDLQELADSNQKHGRNPSAEGDKVSKEDAFRPYFKPPSVGRSNSDWAHEANEKDAGDLKSSPFQKRHNTQENPSADPFALDGLSALQTRRGMRSVSSPSVGASHLPPIPSQCLLRPGELEPLNIHLNSRYNGAKNLNESHSTALNSYNPHERDLATPTQRIEDDTLRLFLAAHTAKGDSHREAQVERSNGLEERQHLLPRPHELSALPTSQRYDWAAKGGNSQHSQHGSKRAINDVFSSGRASIRPGLNSTTIRQNPRCGSRETPKPMDEFNQSATEIATPTRLEFSNLPPFTKALDHVKAWVDAHSEEAKGSHIEIGKSEAQVLPIISAPLVNDKCGTHTEPTVNQKGATHADDTWKLDPNVASLSSLLPHLQLLVSRLTEYPALWSALEAYKHRLDALECASYSHGVSEELQEKFDMLDGRLTELEGKVEEHEKLHADFDFLEASRPSRTSVRKRVHGGVAGTECSVSSDGSSDAHSELLSSARVSAALDRSGLPDRLEDMGSRIQALETSAPPSYDNPYELEVIFLPWGPGLKGIWYPPEELSNGELSSTAITEEWADPQFRDSLSSSLSRSRSSGYDGWDGDPIRSWADGPDEWLVPRASAQNSTIYRRLQSRGFVRNVQILGSTAKEVISAVSSAFGDILDDRTFENQSNKEDIGELKKPKSCDSDCMVEIERTDAYERQGTCQGMRKQSSKNKIPLLGLRAPFIPLRKIHKDSRLRFLDPDELVTPAVWTSDFLSRTVVMRAAGGARRLFITNRHGYLQPRPRDCLAWTWQMLRELPRVHLDENGEQREEAVPEADAKEACWQWDPRLDPPTSAASSFASDSSLYSTLSIRPSRLAQSVRSKNSLSPSPKLREPTPCGDGHAMPISPLSEFPVDRLGYLRRTNSLSLGDSGSALSPSFKRRLVASQVESAPSKTLSKRRRVSYSPTFIPSRDQNITEPWRQRCKSPSPFFSEVADGRSQLAMAGVKRGTTPFAYATPHSGPVAMISEPSSGKPASAVASDNNTEILIDNFCHKTEPEEEVWEGVADEDASQHLASPEAAHSDDDNMLTYSPSLSEQSYSAYESDYDSSDDSEAE